MRRWCQPLSVVMVLLLTGLGLAGTTDWVQFADETDFRLVADSAVGADDDQEKDYAWGDVDQDGDIDLIAVRKQPFSTQGGRRNVLFMNEGVTQGHAINGVLVDRTERYATEADDGGQGFLDETNDRDVALVDVNGDGWLDIVTAVTCDGCTRPPKTISHPRVYINKANDEMGGWLGFRYDEARIPQFVDPKTGEPVAPNFAAVAFGDVTGDDAVDLYFANYNQNLEDRLLVNDGKGFFTDETERRLPSEFVQSQLGYACAIADMNADGFNDIVKNAHHTPIGLAIAYNDSSNEGFFRVFDLVYDGAPVYVSVGDLNNDGKLDMVVPDDGLDRYFLNQGNGPDGLADFIAFTFPNSSLGFASNAVIADLNDDGFTDVLVADVDVDLPGCSRQLHIYRNDGSIPIVSFVENSGGIPDIMLQGTHDVAVFDLNGDFRLDLIIGRCAGTTVWIQQVIGDLDGDGTVGILDLLILLNSWGPCPDPPQGCPADLDGDGSVGILDLLTLLANWG